MGETVIGVTAGAPPPGVMRLHEPIAACYLPASYINAIRQAGARPVILPPSHMARECDRALGELADPLWVLERVDGILLSGGPDPDPWWFGEEPRPGQGRIDPERDAWEIVLARAALEAGMPVLGICRGVQVMAVAAGGALYQDISEGFPAALKHMQEAPRWFPSHGVEVAQGTKLASVIGAGACRVNSFHHQAIRDPGQGFVVSARAPDGVIEAIESRNQPFALGVQWHPEAMCKRDSRARALFASLVEAARGWRGRGRYA